MTHKIDPSQGDFSEIGGILVADAEIITGKWMEKERHELASSKNAHRKELRDMIPKYLRALGAELAGDENGLPERYLIAREHGRQRWQTGWKLNEVVADYQLLKITVLEHLADLLKRSLTVEEMKTTGSYIDDAIIDAVTAYTERSKGELKALNQTLEERVRDGIGLTESRLAKLRKAAVDLIKAKQNERRRIARILHDDLQQLIAACRLRIDGLQLTMAESLFTAEVSVIILLLDKALTVSKNLALELKPPIDAGNVSEMLLWVKGRMLSEFDLDLDLDIAQQHVTVKNEIGLLVYQNLRELLFNVVKHAGCRQATVKLGIDDGSGWLKVAVCDSGAGFDPAALTGPTDHGFGLYYIRERLEMIDGQLDIDSAVGRGTIITMRVPIRIDR
ncbi:MAG: ATP-binding protein [Desulfobacterales bacterium]